MKNLCAKCGALNGGKSKHKWFIFQGNKCCGHCGSAKKTSSQKVNTYAG